MLDWLAEHQRLFLWLGVLSVGSLVLVALLLPLIVVRLPADHFVRPHRIGHGRRGWLDWLWHLGKNALGAVFVLAGLAMLLLPGQGLLTIAIGLLLMDFPGKRRLELRLLSRPKILQLINRLRAKHGRPPLLVKAGDAP